MNREQLEAVVRRQFTRVVASALDGRAPTAVMNRATETILDAADNYATTEVGLLTPAERRRALEQATS